MICNCGGIFNLYPVKNGLAGKCPACGRRHEVIKNQQPQKPKKELEET